MCNLFANTLPAEAMRRLFDVPADRDDLGNAPPLDAIWPRGEIPVVRRDVDGGRSLVRMHWGFLMPQVSNRTGQPIMPKAVNNARDDRLRASPFWRESFAQRRCLIPATAWAEQKGVRPAVIHWFAITGDGPRPPFAFAGLWRRWRGEYRGEQVEIDTATIVTTDPNALTATVHPDRMPTVLAPDDWATWLGGPSDAALALIRPWPAERTRIAAVGVDRDPGV
jgi:putative SOS response-associated peptidase YedK